MHTLVVVVKILLGLTLLVALIGALRTWQLEHTAKQKLFVAGTMPDPALNGFYRGKISFPTSWLGKRFDAANHSGVNIWGKGNGAMGESSAFVTFAAKGRHDTQLDVLAINYNIPGNLWYLHPVLDELVQISPDHYLGKLQLRLFPGFPFTIAFFELEK